jgi:hypothetical protein
MYDVYKPVIQIVNYSTTVQVFEFDISAKFPTIPKINKIITNVATRIIDFVKGYWHICDIQYNGLQNAGTDLFHVIITNNLKDGAENYQLISLSIPHVCNKLDDILANVEPLFDTYKDSAHNIILNSVEKIEKNIFKFFYDVDNSYGGIIFNTPPMVVAINNPPEGDLIIKGSGKVGENLTLDSSTIKDLDGMGPLSYKWFIEGIKDPVSSGNNYTPVVGDVGKNIMAIAYYVDGKQNNEKVESSNIKIISKPWVVGSNDPSPYLTLKILKAGENYTDYPPVGLGDWHPITPGIYYHAVVDINNTSYTNYTWEYSVDGINWLWYYYFSVSPARAIWGQWSSPYIRCYVTDDTGQKLYSNNFLATGV